MGRKHCIFCQSPYHDYRRCPLAHLQQKIRRNAGTQGTVAGQSPNVFVGSYGYPRVQVGFLSVEEYTEHDDPAAWSRKNRSIPYIVGLRTSLLNSSFTQQVRSFEDRLATMAQEVSMARRPAEIEVSLQRPPGARPSFTAGVPPHGPRVPLKNARFTSNTRVDHRIERIVNDTDCPARTGIAELHKRGVSEHRLASLLSVGNLGIRPQRRFVPTRWSITAVDTMLSDKLLAAVKLFREDDCRVFTGAYLGNEYVIAFLDEAWSFELFEGFLPALRSGDEWETDSETFAGRKGYAEETKGGYYATRHAVLEALQRRRRQASVLALRFITQEYTVPLGVWVVREAVRRTLQSTGRVFADREGVKRFIIDYCRARFQYDCRGVLSRSMLLRRGRQQKLGAWL